MDTAHAKNSTSPSNGDKEIVVTATSTTAIPAGSTPAADGVAGGYAVVLGEDGKPLSATQLKKRRAKQEKEAKKLETQRRVAAEKAAERAAREPNTVDYSAGKYGALPLNQSQERTGRKRTRIEDLSESLVDQVVLVQARIHKRNPWGGMCFLTLRQRAVTVQAVVAKDAANVSRQMLNFVTDITFESLVLVEAIVVKAKELVKSCTIQSVELKVKQIHVISKAAERLPFAMEDASRGEEEEGIRVLIGPRLDGRIIDLRTQANQAIFRMQSGVCQLFHDFLTEKGFIEIHTPKIVAAAGEGGRNAFKIKYFNRDAYLAQSPQLYKQMAICSDFERVFEIAPVFREEMAFSRSRMTEFVGLDLEMAFEEHYHEVLDLFDKLFVFIFDGLKTRFAAEIEAVKKQFPFEDFLYLPKTLRLDFKEGIKMLREAGAEIDDFDGMTIDLEKKLGRLVREKYKTDFYMLDKFPLALRSFHTMPDPHNPGYSNSYDFFIHGEEILSGGQRVHDTTLLESRAREHRVDLETIRPYIDAFKYGAPPHGGGGIGLERLIMLYLNLGNVRRTSMFPRDAKRLSP